MRRALRVVMTLLFPASLALVLLPLIQFGPAGLRPIDLLRLMLGRETGLPLNDEILLRLGTYLSPFLYPTVALLISILAAFLISLCLPQRGACYLSLVFPALMNVGAFFLLRQILDKLEEVRPALPFFSLPDVLELTSTTVLIWAGLWVGVMLLATICLALSLAAQARAERDAFLPEMAALDSPAYRAAEQDYRNQVARLERAAPAGQDPCEPPTVPPEPDSCEPPTVAPAQDPCEPPTVAPAQDPYEPPTRVAVQDSLPPEPAAVAAGADAPLGPATIPAGPADAPLEPDTIQAAPIPAAPARPAFSGAVLGQSGRYRGLAYPLEDRQAVYFSFDGHEIFLQPRQGSKAIAELYYVSQYQEYCLRPLSRLTVFLSSGQPLGANRRYFLPRGTELYLLGQGHTFSLA